MKLSQLVTIASIALVVVVVGAYFTRPKQLAGDAGPVQTEPLPVESPQVELAPALEMNPTTAKVETPIQESGAAVTAKVGNASSPMSKDSARPESSSIYESNAELAAGTLPKDLTDFLQRGVIPDSEGILRSNQVARNQEQDPLAVSIEETMRSFLAAQPEIRSFKYLVSCGVRLCTIQMEQKDSAAGEMALPLLHQRLETQPWFHSALVPARSGGFFTKDGHPYFFGYWDRK